MKKIDNPNDADIIGRIEYLMGNGEQRIPRKELARLLNIDPSNLSKYLTGRLPISQNFLNAIVVNLGVSKNWLLTGEGIPYPKQSEPEMVTATEVQQSVVKRGVPVYDIDVTAGCLPLERLLTVDRITGYVDLPKMNPDSIIVRVMGDSMEPKINDGGMIAIRPVNPLGPIFWGQIYVVVLEDFRMVKYLRRHPDDKSMVILRSENPNYDDIDLPSSEIRALFVVESILNYKNVC